MSSATTQSVSFGDFGLLMAAGTQDTAKKEQNLLKSSEVTLGNREKRNHRKLNTMENGSRHQVFRWNDKIWKIDDGQTTENGDDKYFVVVHKLFVQWSKVN